MSQSTPSSKGWTIALWAAQLLLAAAYGLFGSMKATQPLDQLAQMMTWIPSFPPLFVRTLGVAEVLGAIGLILPSLTRIQPRLTVLAAQCILLHQAFAVALHVFILPSGPIEGKPAILAFFRSLDAQKPVPVFTVAKVPGTAHAGMTDWVMNPGKPGSLKGRDVFVIRGGKISVQTTIGLGPADQ